MCATDLGNRDPVERLESNSKGKGRSGAGAVYTAPPILYTSLPRNMRKMQDQSSFPISYTLSQPLM